MDVDEIEVVKLDNDGDSPLAMASHKGHIDIVRLLLPIGDMANLRNKKGVTPVFLAAENGHLEIVRLLIEVGVDVCLKDKHGFMPLHIASQNGHAPVVAEFLLTGDADEVAACPGGAGGVDTNASHVRGRKETKEKDLEVWQCESCDTRNTPDLDVCDMCGEDRKYFDVNDATKSGATSLLIAAENGHLEVVRHIKSTAISFLNGLLGRRYQSQHGHSLLSLLYQ